MKKLLKWPRCAVQEGDVVLKYKDCAWTPVFETKEQLQATLLKLAFTLGNEMQAKEKHD